MTFLALLELIRLKRVKVYQRGHVRRRSACSGRWARRRRAPPQPTARTSREGRTGREASRRAPKRRRGRPASRAGDGRGRRTTRTPAETPVLPAAGGPRGAGGAGLRLAAADHAARDRAGAGRACRKEAWQAALEELSADYARDGRGLQLVEVAGGYQITTRPEYNDWVRELLDPQRADAAVDPGAGDAGRHRLQAAGDPARDHRAARREVGRRR